MIKKIVFACSLIILFVSSALAQTAKTDDELLAETVELSKQVKEFGKTIGIEPSLALTKSSKEQKTFSLLWINIQKKGSVAFETLSRLALGLDMEANKIQIAKYWLGSKHYSTYIRQTNEFAGDTASVTLDFAKADMVRKIMVILHEDLHKNIHANTESSYNIIETLVNPLGFLSALKYFEQVNDQKNVAETLHQIDYYRKISLELNLLEKDIKIIATKVDPQIVCAELWSKGFFDQYPIFRDRLSPRIKSHGGCVAEEAFITNEMLYWKYFNKVIALYEKSGNLKTMISDMKKAPDKQNDLENFLDELDQKYSPHNSPNPLLP